MIIHGTSLRSDGFSQQQLEIGVLNVNPNYVPSQNSGMSYVQCSPTLQMHILEICPCSLIPYRLVINSRVKLVFHQLAFKWTVFRRIVV